MRTIRRRLLGLLFGGMLSATLVAGMVTYIELRIETNNLFDRQLQQIAAALPDEMSRDRNLPTGNEAGEEITVQVWDQGGTRIFTSGPVKDVPSSMTPGFSSATVNGTGWRLYIENDNGQITQIAQPDNVRSRLAAAMALRTLMPFFALIPILGILIWIAVGKSLQPLQSLAKEVKSRSPASLTPLIPENYPPELHAILTALNALLAQLEGTLHAQRAFVADAAHELRTPLTALKLQLQLIEKESHTHIVTDGFPKLHARLNRATHVVHQLLTLARHEQLPAGQNLVPLDPMALIVDIVSDHALQAESKGIDLGAVAADLGPVLLLGNEESLRILLGNLVDNAIRYTPSGGRVDVGLRTKDDSILIQIADDGPGIAEHERERVFARFHRGEGTGEIGSGLGLFIARTIADHHRARITLDTSPLGGLLVTVHFPFPTTGIR